MRGTNLSGRPVGLEIIFRIIFKIILLWNFNKNFNNNFERSDPKKQKRFGYRRNVYAMPKPKRASLWSFGSNDVFITCAYAGCSGWAELILNVDDAACRDDTLHLFIENYP